MRRASLSAGLATTILLACGTPRAPALAPIATLSPAGLGAVGCWRFLSELWSDVPLNSVVLHLDTVPAFREDSVRMHLAFTPSDSVVHQRTAVSYWAIYESHRDSVYAVLGDGLTGLEVRLRVLGDTLRGRAHSFVDFSPAPRRSRSVLAVRDSCTAAT